MTTVLRRQQESTGNAAVPFSGPTRLVRLFVEQGQSPWVDHLTRDDVEDGSLSRLVLAGIRGATVDLAASATPAEVFAVQAACAILRPVYESSHAIDGLVSVEMGPAAGDRDALMGSAQRLRQCIDRPNLLVAIPATRQGLPVAQSMVAAGANVNTTSIFTIDGYSAAIDAYLAGLERLVADGGDVGNVRGVATFCVAEVDEAVNRRLDRVEDRRATGLHGRAGVAQAKLAYRLFNERFSTDRWARLARHGAQPQRLLWSSETEGPRDAGTGYVDELIGPDTVHALSKSTVAAFEDHGVVDRTLDTGLAHAAWVLSKVGALNIDLDEVGAELGGQDSALVRRVSDRAMDRLDAEGPAR